MRENVLMWHDGMPGSGMIGYGWTAGLIWVVVLLVIAALVKYLFSGNRRR